MHLFIHTAGRPDRMATYGSLPPNLQKNTTVVVQYRERQEYDNLEYNDLWVLPPGITRLSPTRQYILDHGQKYCGSRYICMMDDDFVSFGWRRNASAVNQSVATGPQITSMFNQCHKWLQSGIAHCGISPRVRNHTVEQNVAVNTRMTQMLCYDLKVVQGNDFRMDRVPLMQDFDMTLQMLRAGFSNKVLYRGCTNARGSNVEGGCNLYRTRELQSKTARKLAKLHPGFVKLRTKRTGLYKEEGVTDVTVFWKKAYNSSLEKTV